MKKLRLIWHLYPAFLFVTFAAVVAVAWYLSTTLRDFHIEQVEQSLTARAHLVAARIGSEFHPDQAGQLDAISKQLGRQTDTRITLIMPSGKVLADSDENPQHMDNHAGRPEISVALKGQVGVATRFSRTLQQNQMYVAIPLRQGDDIIGSVRTSIPVTAIDRTLAAVYRQIVTVGIGVALVLGLLSLLLARRISAPLEAMRRGAERFAIGEFDRQLPATGAEELAGLSQSLNRMAAQLDERFQTVVRQRNEQEAVLSSMVEGVLAIDNDEQILRLNRAAGKVLEIEPVLAVGRPVQEVLRKVELQKFIADAIASDRPLERDITLLVGGERRQLQAHATALRNAQDEKIGVLVVLNDVTRLRRLESMRRDFVANVSHELKTPITAIKGWAETLRDSEVEFTSDTREPIDIIARQADRLNAIINDLLELSRIEQDQEGTGIELDTGRLLPVLEAARVACSVEAEEKNLTVELHCSAEIEARINAPLLEQAIVNLLGNAIKYSSRDARVVLDAAQIEDRVMIKVQDFGCGIPAEHIPRLFERFYRVDPARSRELGGTGLGLAIVKHIAQAHRGEIEVHSTSGQGSTFTLILPLP